MHREINGEALDLQHWNQEWVDHALENIDEIFGTFYEEKIIDKIFGDK